MRIFSDRQSGIRLGTLLGAALLAALAGCENPGSAPSTAGAGRSDDMTQRADKVAQAPAAVAEPAQPAPPPQQPPVAVQTADEAPAASPDASAASDEAKRAQAEDMIYATIRIKMEEMIEERASLLKSGKDPTDPRIRELEGSIMRARDLLTERGEIVPDVEPPIVQTAPKRP